MKNFLELEKWSDLFQSNDKQRLDYEMAQLQDALKEIKSGELNFDGMESNEQAEPEPQDIQYDRQRKQEFNIFGVDLTQLDSQTKNIIGIALIFLIFAVAAYGVFWLKNQANKRNKKEPKKKNN